VKVGELPQVEVSAAAVELAVSNFVSNAIKYADPAKSERWVMVRGATVETGTGPETVVTVSDNGIGVPPEKRERLFERGFRAHIDSVTGVEGDGLGLSIVKDALDAIGGRVWAEFAPEGGASFSSRCRRGAPARIRFTTSGGARSESWLCWECRKSASRSGGRRSSMARASRSSAVSASASSAGMARARARS
jgi:light-regulated signal transduction histidine kinase (bacteriophytochrome)